MISPLRSMRRPFEFLKDEDENGAMLKEVKDWDNDNDNDIGLVDDSTK